MRSKLPSRAALKCVHRAKYSDSVRLTYSFCGFLGTDHTHSFRAGNHAVPY